MNKVKEVHIEEFGSEPEIILSAPGRFHLIGEHSWFFEDKTLSMAVDLPVYIAITRRQDSALRFYFPQLKERKRANLSTLKYRREDRWANEIKAIIFGYNSIGYSFTGMNITIYSDILPSAGFGITTAIKAVSALALKKLYKIEGSDTILLQVIERACKIFLTTGFYSADINTALFAKKDTCLLTDHSQLTFKTVPYNFSESSIILTDARVPRISLWNEESLRNEENKKLLASLKTKKNNVTVYEDSISEINDVLSVVSEDVRRRLICIMKENQFVLDAVDALNNSSIQNFSKAINKSHEVMRDLYLISCPEIDWLVKRVQEFDQTSTGIQTSCSRITGKGFGRCTYTIVKNEYVEPYMQKLAEYERIFGFHPASYIVHPSDGACISQNN